MEKLNLKIIFSSRERMLKNNKKIKPSQDHYIRTKNKAYEKLIGSDNMKDFLSSLKSNDRGFGV